MQLHASEADPSAVSVPVSSSSSGQPLADLILATLDDRKAEDVTVIDLAGKTSIADKMIIASGRSTRQVAAIAHALSSKLKDEGHGLPKVEGLPQADWVLIDAGDVIVHLFRPEVRDFYNLEKMWSIDLTGDQAFN